LKEVRASPLQLNVKELVRRTGSGSLEAENTNKLTLPKVLWCRHKGNGKNCCFKHMAGFWKHPLTGKPSPPTPCQDDLSMLVAKHHWVWNNKSKKIGITAGALDIFAFNAVTSYAQLGGGEIMLVAGNRMEHAVSLMDRFRPILTGEPNPYIKGTGIYKDLVEEETSSRLKLSNGVEINAYPSNASSVVGRPLVRGIYWDEIAYSGIIDDKPNFNNLFANASNTRADFLGTSTPNGKRGIFYEKAMAIQGLIEEIPSAENPIDLGWYYIEYPYELGLMAGLLDQQTIDKAMQDPMIDFDQLYRCKFTTPKGAFITEDLIRAMEADYAMEDI